MADMRLIIAKNLIDLRKSQGMTQLELAERLNYSDKAVSKWERGESLPDITVIKTIADLFGVTVDYLITEEHEVPAPLAEAAPKKKISFRTAATVTGKGILLAIAPDKAFLDAGRGAHAVELLLTPAPLGAAAEGHKALLPPALLTE